MTRFDDTLDWIGQRLVNHVTCPADPAKTPTHSDIAQLRRTLRVGDVLLIDGRDRVSAAIRWRSRRRESRRRDFPYGAAFEGEEIRTPAQQIIAIAWSWM